MGGSHSSLSQQQIPFDPAIYVRPGMEEKDIINIYLLFQSFSPQAGKIQVLPSITEPRCPK